MIHISLFSGLGGFELAAEKMCWKNYVCCETNEFCNTILKYYWPSAYHHKEIKTLTYEKINKELRVVLAQEEVKQKLIAFGGSPAASSPQEFKARVEKDIRNLKKVVQDKKIELE